MNMENLFNEPQIRDSVIRMNLIADEYRSDPEARERASKYPHAYLAQWDIDLGLPPGGDVRLVVNTPETFHVVLPPDPNVALDDEALSVVAGGKSASSAGSASTASTAPSCASTASSIGTAGSAS